MPNCTTCGAYTNYEGGLCYNCCRKAKGKAGETEEEEVSTPPSEDLSNRDGYCPN